MVGVFEGVWLEVYFCFYIFEVDEGVVGEFVVVEWFDCFFDVMGVLVFVGKFKVVVWFGVGWEGWCRFEDIGYYWFGCVVVLGGDVEMFLVKELVVVGIVVVGGIDVIVGVVDLDCILIGEYGFFDGQCFIVVGL